MSGDHVREGLGAIISVKVPSPEFEGQTKTRLGNPEVRKIVETLVVQVREGYLLRVIIKTRVVVQQYGLICLKQQAVSH